MTAKRASKELIAHCIVLRHPDQCDLNICYQKCDCVGDGVDGESKSIVLNVLDNSNPQIFDFLRIKLYVLLVVVQDERLTARAALDHKGA